MLVQGGPEKGCGGAARVPATAGEGVAARRRVGGLQGRVVAWIAAQGGGGKG